MFCQGVLKLSGTKFCVQLCTILLSFLTRSTQYTGIKLYTILYTTWCHFKECPIKEYLVYWIKLYTFFGTTLYHFIECLVKNN